MSLFRKWQKLGITGLAGGIALLSGELAFAQSAKNSGYEVVVVTGERVERSLLNTASSVSVFDESRLSELGAEDRIEQILDFVPNLQRGSHDTGVAIRGQDTTGVLIGANAFLGGTRPRATLQIDGRALNFNEFLYGLSPIWDVERIEVFRGPQTTTQGRNAIAGAIFIETKDPTFDFEGAARAIVGNYDTRQASLALSGPLVDKQLAARIALDVREHESWMDYTSPDVFVGANREDDNYATGRVKLLFTPSAIPDLALKLTYSHLDATNPQGETANEPYDDRVQLVQTGAHWDTRVDSLVLAGDYAFTDSWSVSLTGTIAESESERFAAPGRGTAVVEADEYSVEGLLRFNPSAGPLRGLLGASFFASDQDEFSDFSAFPTGLGEFRDEQESIGLFGEVTYDLLPTLHLTLGGRWQEDTQERAGALGVAVLDYDETFSEFLPKAEIAYDLQDNIVIGATARKGFNPGGTTVGFFTGIIDEFDAETLWSYELFSRAVLADGALLLMGNIFYTDFTDSQRQRYALVGANVETSFDNAPSAESYGFEFESVWTVNPTLQLRASLGYLKTEITDTEDPQDLTRGNEFQRAPELTAMLGISLHPTDALTLDLNARYHSDYFSDDLNTADYEIDAETIIDAKASYDFGTINVYAYVRNATDETYQVWQFMPGNSSLGDPREYGLGIETHF